MLKVARRNVNGRGKGKCLNHMPLSVRLRKCVVPLDVFPIIQKSLIAETTLKEKDLKKMWITDSNIARNIDWTSLFAKLDCHRLKRKL